MKIGFPNNPRKDPLKEIEWIGKNGFDFVDFFLEAELTDLNKINIEKIKQLLKKYNLDIVGHTSWQLPIASSIKRLRDACIDELKGYLPVFQKLGVEKVTVHTCWHGIGGLFSEKEGTKFQIETLKRIVKEAKRYNIKIMLEPVGDPKDKLKNIKEILESVPGLCFHLDIGHESLHGKDIEKIIETFKGKIVHVHMSDNNKKSDQHLPIGCGAIDWKTVIKILKKYYNGTITLEVFSNDKDYVLISKEKIMKLWNSS